MKLFSKTDTDKCIDCLYEIKDAVKPDEYLAKLRELKIAKLKKDMGNSYLLAVPFKRNTNLEN